MKEKNRKQIIFDVTPEMHTQIKVLSAMRNISMNLFMVRAIADKIAKENEYNKKEEFK